MSFAGLAPEIINGRAAMIGMLTAFGAEFATGDTVMAQVNHVCLVTIHTILKEGFNLPLCEPHEL